VSKTVPLVFWGDLFKNHLDNLGVSLEEIQSSFTGSRIFGHGQAPCCSTGRRPDANPAPATPGRDSV
jgi:hypothetical protein